MRTFAYLALGLAPLALDAQPPRPEPFPGLDDYVRGALATWKVPGAALAVVRHDSVVYLRRYGVRTAGTGAGAPTGFFLEFTLDGDKVTGATLEQPQPRPTLTFVPGAA
jgi:CubicO group peptidase (beta-lactamase class C family)